MSNYYIEKTTEKKEIIYMRYRINGYNFKPKNDTHNSFNLHKITVVKPSLIDGILSQKVEKQISKIVRLVMYILNTDEDANPGDTMLALNEIARLRSVILNRYQDFITQENETIFLRKLRILENELRAKNMAYDDYNFGGPRF